MSEKDPISPEEKKKRRRRTIATVGAVAVGAVLLI